MSSFSEHLEQCIFDSGMTENQLAKVSGFNRSYIALMKNGQRVSPDSKKMQKLIQALNLPPYENDKLWSEYIQARVGDEIYKRNSAVIELIESFGSISKTLIRSFYYHDIPDISTVDNQMDLEYLIRAVAEQEALREDGYIHILMQTDVPVLKNILPVVCKNNQNLQVEHIICLNEQTGNEHVEEQLYNIHVLKYLMPIAIFVDSRFYQVYHYYDDVKSRFNTVSLMPYLFLTHKYAISINANMNIGMVFKDEEIVNLYEQLFQRQKRNCRMTLRRIEDEMDLFDYLSTHSGEDAIYSIAPQPCFGTLGVEELVKKYCFKGKEKFRIRLEGVLRRNGKLMENERFRTVSYCTKSGLRKFAEQGIVDELPQEMYSILDIPDRISILQRLLELIRQGKYELYLLEDQGIAFPEELFITSNGFSDATLMYMSRKEKARFALNENSLTRILYEFFQDFMKSPQVSSAEKSMLFVEHLLEQLQKL